MRSAATHKLSKIFSRSREKNTGVYHRAMHVIQSVTIKTRAVAHASDRNLIAVW